MSEYEVELYKIIGEMIRDIRTNQGYTMEQIAEKLGVTTKTLQRYETGARKIKINTVMELSNILGFNYNDFMADAKLKLSGSDGDNQYYINDETREIAQEIFENKELRMLFDAGKNANPEDLKMVYDMLLHLKRKENYDE